MKIATISLSVVALLSLFGPGAAAAAPPPAAGQPLAKAAFAGGCFWCMVHPFDQLPGVVKVTSGYAGGHAQNPTYEEVSGGSTGHAESVEVVYDPAKVTYQKLLDTYWHNVDPFTPNAQFCDHGNQYRTAIFYATPEQKKLAEASKADMQHRFKEPIVTQIVPLTQFWPAEDYHQDYYKKNPIRYKFYRYNCGRDRRLEQIWGAAPAE